MSAGCLIVGSRTAPFEEVLRDNDNGLLFWRRGVSACGRGLEGSSCAGCDAKRDAIVESFDLARVCQPAHLALMNKLVAMTR